MKIQHAQSILDKQGYLELRIVGYERKPDIFKVKKVDADGCWAACGLAAEMLEDDKECGKKMAGRLDEMIAIRREAGLV